MPHKRTFADFEVAAFLDQLPRSLTFDDRARLCLEQFGAARAWSRAKIVRYWSVTHPFLKGQPSRIDSDHELRALIDGMIGSNSPAEIRAACVAEFGASRAAQTPTIRNYIHRVTRERLQRVAVQLLTPPKPPRGKKRA